MPITIFLAILAGACLETATTTDLRDGRTLYVEERSRPDCDRRSGTETVVYRLPSGERFGGKTIVHRSGTLPEVRMTQSIPPRTVEVRIRDRTALISVDAKGKRQEHRVEVPEGTVLDAGIDIWIASRLGRIAAGEHLVVPILLPEFGRVLEFEASRAAGGSSREIRVQLVPRNRLLRLLADRLVATYDRASGRLVAYEGISDVKDPDGKNFRVRLRYRTEPAGGGSPAGSP